EGEREERGGGGGEEGGQGRARTPRMMIMNSPWNERLMSKASGSHEPSRRKPHIAPAMPMKKELTAKAESLVLSGRKPMISAAMSMSRIAIHERPMWPRTRFLATSVATTTMARIR